MKQPTCKERVKKEWASERSALKKLFLDYEKGTEKYASEYGTLPDHGLSIDYVKPYTFKHQRTPYIRYQFSWGGPSDELRIYKNGKIEYWFMDWFDGAKVDVTNDKIARKAADYAQNLVPFT